MFLSIVLNTPSFTCLTLPHHTTHIYHRKNLLSYNSELEKVRKTETVLNPEVVNINFSPQIAFCTANFFNNCLTPHTK